MRNLKLKSLAVGVAAIMGAAAHADQILINPGVSYYFNDSERNLQNTEAYSLGLEYIFGDRIGVAASALTSSPQWDETTGFEDPDHLAYSIDALYYFGQAGDKLRPYAVMGVGEGEWEFEQTDLVETQLNAGAGVRYEVAPHTTLRGDVRVIHGIDEETIDETINLGVSYAFDLGSPKKAAPAPAPAPVPVAVVEQAKDSDGDGVLDQNDKCPGTRAGAKVDDNGCELVKTAVESIRLNVQFPTASAVVAPRYNTEIQKVADFLKKYPDVTAVIEGHTDAQGKDEYNQKLSSSRANSVRDVLIKTFKIDAARVTAVGYGESKPLATNDTPAGRQENRRVVAVLQKEIAVTQ